MKSSQNPCVHKLFASLALFHRSGVFLAANIAEGYGRQYRNEYIQFLDILESTS
ncbi:MAG: four helix bundle protein [Hassallia sp.]